MTHEELAALTDKELSEWISDIVGWINDAHQRRRQFWVFSLMLHEATQEQRKRHHALENAKELSLASNPSA